MIVATSYGGVVVDDAPVRGAFAGAAWVFVAVMCSSSCRLVRLLTFPGGPRQLHPRHDGLPEDGVAVGAVGELLHSDIAVPARRRGCLRVVHHPALRPVG